MRNASCKAYLSSYLFHNPNYFQVLEFDNNSDLSDLLFYFFLFRQVEQRQLITGYMLITLVS